MNIKNLSVIIIPSIFLTACSGNPSNDAIKKKVDAYFNSNQKQSQYCTNFNTRNMNLDTDYTPNAISTLQTPFVVKSPVFSEKSKTPIFLILNKSASNNVLLAMEKDGILEKTTSSMIFQTNYRAVPGNYTEKQADVYVLKNQTGFQIGTDDYLVGAKPTNNTLPEDDTNNPISTDIGVPDVSGIGDGISVVFCVGQSHAEKVLATKMINIDGNKVFAANVQVAYTGIPKWIEDVNKVDKNFLTNQPKPYETAVFFAKDSNGWELVKVGDGL